jgi:acylphosphatase
MQTLIRSISECDVADTSNISVRVQIYGKVHGVWFRGWTKREADARRLDGWVRNRSDGSVEALFSGESAAVRAMIAQCRVGPPAARVERIEETPEIERHPPGFAQKPTW